MWVRKQKVAESGRGKNWPGIKALESWSHLCHKILWNLGKYLPFIGSQLSCSAKCAGVNQVFSGPSQLRYSVGNNHSASPFMRWAKRAVQIMPNVTRHKLLDSMEAALWLADPMEPQRRGGKDEAKWWKYLLLGGHSWPREHFSFTGSSA